MQKLCDVLTTDKDTEQKNWLGKYKNHATKVWETILTSSCIMRTMCIWSQYRESNYSQTERALRDPRAAQNGVAPPEVTAGAPAVQKCGSD